MGDAVVPATILHGTAAHLAIVTDSSVDLVCIDPPYYNNVQYGELSDFYYVWQRRTLDDLYPELYARRLVNRRDEAVASPARDGSAEAADAVYQRMMQEIFAECRRVLKPDGLMTVMFTHISQKAWQALTQSLIESGWTITSTVPVTSEGSNSMHQRDLATAASAVLLTTRKRDEREAAPAGWTGIGGTGVQQRVRRAVEEGLHDFEPLHLNPVDEMVACYGRALQVLSEHWPVMDGDERVSPLRAMNEASSVVAANQMARITKGRIAVAELDGETRMALTMVGIFGLAEFAWDEALNLSRSLGIGLYGAAGGYEVVTAGSASTPRRGAGLGAPAAPRRSRMAMRRRWCGEARSCALPLSKSEIPAGWPRRRPTGIAFKVSSPNSAAAIRRSRAPISIAMPATAKSAFSTSSMSGRPRLPIPN
jgi:putative DNA methylase